MEKVKVDIDVITEEAVTELKKYFQVLCVEDAGTQYVVELRGERIRVKAWLVLNCFDDIDELWPMLAEPTLGRNEDGSAGDGLCEECECEEVNDGEVFCDDCEDAAEREACGCPGCGTLPGEGRTDGCNHPEGCGYMNCDCGTCGDCRDREQVGPELSRGDQMRVEKGLPTNAEADAMPRTSPVTGEQYVGFLDEPSGVFIIDPLMSSDGMRDEISDPDAEWGPIWRTTFPEIARDFDRKRKMESARKASESPRLFVTIIKDGYLELAVASAEHRHLLDGAEHWLGDEWQLEVCSNAHENGFYSKLFPVDTDDETAAARIVVDMLQAMMIDGPEHFVIEIAR